MRRQRQALGLRGDIPMPGEPARRTRSGALKQAGDRVGRHYLGSTKTTREAACRRAGAGPEIENPRRGNANAVKALKQSIACGQHDPRELGVSVARAREDAPDRNSIERRWRRMLRGWWLHHDHRVWVRKLLCVESRWPTSLETKGNCTPDARAVSCTLALSFRVAASSAIHTKRYLPALRRGGRDHRQSLRRLCPRTTDSA